MKQFQLTTLALGALALQGFVAEATRTNIDNKGAPTFKNQGPVELETATEKAGFRTELTAKPSGNNVLGGDKRDRTFKPAEKKNSNLLYPDLGKLFETPTPSQKHLRRKVKNFLKGPEKKKTKAASKSSKDLYQSPKKRLGVDNQVGLRNVGDLLYHGSIFMGTQDMKMEVVFDTSSDWLVIEGQECGSCLGAKYDPTTSSAAITQSTEIIDRYYGKEIHLRGYQMQDQVCLTSFSNCVDPFDWYMITDQYGIPPELDGVLGLTLGGIPKDPQPDFSVGPLYLNSLYTAGHITEKTFSLHFEGIGGDSYIDFGPPQDEGMRDVSELTYFNMNNGFFWGAVPQGVRFGDESEDRSFHTKYEFDSIFSSVSVVNIVPKDESEGFFYHLFDGIDYEMIDGAAMIDCATDMPDVYFMFENYWVQISGSDAIIDISEEQDNSVCISSFVPGYEDFWLFGSNIMKDYYVVHDAAGPQIGFAPTKTSLKNALTTGELPTDSLKRSFDWLIFLLNFFLMGGIGGGVYYVVEYHFNKSSDISIGFLNASRDTKHTKLATSSLNAKDLAQLIATLKGQNSSMTAVSPNGRIPVINHMQ